MFGDQIRYANPLKYARAQELWLIAEVKENDKAFYVLIDKGKDLQESSESPFNNLHFIFAFNAQTQLNGMFNLRKLPNIYVKSIICPIAFQSF